VRRILSIVCPWYVLWRIRQLASTRSPDPPLDEWFRGYERAMWEVRVNIGAEHLPAEER
jgi:hypothetical protein